MRENTGDFSFLRFFTALLILRIVFGIWNAVTPGWQNMVKIGKPNQAIVNYIQSNYQAYELGIDEPVQAWKITEVLERKESLFQMLRKKEDTPISTEDYKIVILYKPESDIPDMEAKTHTIRKKLSIDKSNPQAIVVRE
jgi:hypothetical protein